MDCCSDPEFTKWARNEGLSEGTLLMLLREGLASKEDLARLRVEEVEEYLPHYSALQGKQKLELKKVIRELSSQSDTRPASYPASPPCLSSLLDEGETSDYYPLLLLLLSSSSSIIIVIIHHHHQCCCCCFCSCCCYCCCYLMLKLVVALY